MMSPISALGAQSNMPDPFTTSKTNKSVAHKDAHKHTDLFPIH